MTIDASRTSDLQFGNLGHHVQAGAFKPDLARMEVTDYVYGLPIQIQWIYAFLRGEDGAIYVPERKFISTLTGGLFLMTGEDGTLNINPVSGRGYRGELKRTLDPEHRRWDQPMYHRMPAGSVPEGEQDFVMDITNERMEYREGNILDLAGPNAGLGMQFYDSNAENPLFYSSLCYWLEGEVLGDKVEGPIFFDSVYWPHGRDWKEYVYFRELQVGWHVFANKHEDGTVEWGHLVNGHEGFNPGVVIRGNELVAATGDLKGSYTLDDDGWVTGQELDVDGHIYVFEGDEKGWMQQFSESRSHGDNDYRAQYGTTRRLEDPTPAAGFTWLECFANRIKAEGSEVARLPSIADVAV